jgi:hypothetical protein
MPRYALNDADMGHLSDYLKTLAAAADPGVDDSSIHFATIVSEGVDPAEREAMLSVLRAFCRRVNFEVAGNTNRTRSSPIYKDEFKTARRRWRLHVWELAGASSSWPAQLEVHYQKQPVFAILSGLTTRSWAPIHDYCERAEIPCLFPLTDLPVVSEQDWHTPTIYLTKGLSGEAEALALWISQAKLESRSGPVVQVYRETDEGRSLARSFGSAMRREGNTRVRNVILNGDRPTGQFWRRVVNDYNPSQLVLWLTPEDLNSYRPDPRAPDHQPFVYLSSTLVGQYPTSISRLLRGRVRMTCPQTLYGQEGPHIFRVRSWLRSQGLALDHERIRLNTYLALDVTEHALERMVDHFFRDYLIECIEHEMESTQNPGVFPRLSLGPGQRYASKGCYIVAPAHDRDVGLEVLSDWIVP